MRGRFPRNSNGVHQHFMVADVIGEQQNQSGVDGVALRFAAITVQLHQRGVEVVGAF